MSTLIPHDLSNWILDCLSDLQEAMSAVDIKQALALTSLQSQRAEKLAELTGGMVAYARPSRSGDFVGCASARQRSLVPLPGAGGCREGRCSGRGTVTQSQGTRGMLPRWEPEDGEQVLPPFQPAKRGHPRKKTCVPHGLQTCCVGASVPRSDSRFCLQCARTLFGFHWCDTNRVVSKQCAACSPTFGFCQHFEQCPQYCA